MNEFIYDKNEMMYNSYTTPKVSMDSQKSPIASGYHMIFNIAKTEKMFSKDFINVYVICHRFLWNTRSHARRN